MISSLIKLLGDSQRPSDGLLCWFDIYHIFAQSLLRAFGDYSWGTGNENQIIGDRSGDGASNGLTRGICFRPQSPYLLHWYIHAFQRITLSWDSPSSQNLNIERDRKAGTSISYSMLCRSLANKLNIAPSIDGPSVRLERSFFMLSAT